ncbi:uncharacterized protein [Rutidosis leptorrhynchoides]|uniref:uncharacterized protein isoform X2 n=1 Tax=Rutidosis leptorrhynchoides TaxID=125765 RepID=UPI003A99055A
MVNDAPSSDIIGDDFLIGMGTVSLRQTATRDILGRRNRKTSMFFVCPLLVGSLLVDSEHGGGMHGMRGGRTPLLNNRKRMHHYTQKHQMLMFPWMGI